MTRVLAVVGAGAAGLAAAAFAARAAAGRASVLVLEKQREAGRKIMSMGSSSGGGGGGGGADGVAVLPAGDACTDDYVLGAGDPDVLDAALGRMWRTDAWMRWFADVAHVPLRVAGPGGRSLVPASNSAKHVRDALVDVCRSAGVRFALARPVVEVMPVAARRPGERGGFLLKTADWQSVRADAVLLATGGMSAPSTGSEGDGYALLRRLGHAVTKPRPVLAPVLAPHPGGASLAGVVADARVVALRVGAGTEDEPVASRGTRVLFTRTGLAGDAILDVSHRFEVAADGAAARADAPDELVLSWSPSSASEWATRLTGGGGTVLARVAQYVPERLARVLCSLSGIRSGERVAALTHERMLALIEVLTAYRQPVLGCEGFERAHATAGGVSLSELSEAFESRLVPGLYVLGELCDVFGRTGGFNLLWAWETGRAAGTHAAAALAAAE